MNESGNIKATTENLPLLVEQLIGHFDMMKGKLDENSKKTDRIYDELVGDRFREGLVHTVKDLKERIEALETKEKMQSVWSKPLIKFLGIILTVILTQLTIHLLQTSFEKQPVTPTRDNYERSE